MEENRHSHQSICADILVYIFRNIKIKMRVIKITGSLCIVFCFGIVCFWVVVPAFVIKKGIDLLLERDKNERKRTETMGLF